MRGDAERLHLFGGSSDVIYGMMIRYGFDEVIHLGRASFCGREDQELLLMYSSEHSFTQP